MFVNDTYRFEEGEMGMIQVKISNPIAMTLEVLINGGEGNYVFMSTQACACLCVLVSVSVYMLYCICTYMHVSIVVHMLHLIFCFQSYIPST